MAVSVIAKTS